MMKKTLILIGLALASVTPAAPAQDAVHVHTQTNQVVQSQMVDQTNWIPQVRHWRRFRTNSVATVVADPVILTAAQMRKLLAAAVGTNSAVAVTNLQSWSAFRVANTNGPDTFRLVFRVR